MRTAKEARAGLVPRDQVIQTKLVKVFKEINTYIDHQNSEGFSVYSFWSTHEDIAKTIKTELEVIGYSVTYEILAGDPYITVSW